MDVLVGDEKNLPNSVDTRATFAQLYAMRERVIASLEAIPDGDSEEAARLTDTFFKLTGLLKLLIPSVVPKAAPNPLDSSPP